MFWQIWLRHDKNLKLWGQASAGKGKLICNVNNITSYTMPHDSTNVLSGGSLSTSVVERVCLVGQEVKGNACQHFEAIKKGINPAFHTRVVVEGIMVEIAKLRDVPLQGGALKRCGNISFDKSRSLEGYQALKTLDKEQYVLVINVFTHKYYLTFPMCLIEIRIKVA